MPKDGEQGSPTALRVHMKWRVGKRSAGGNRLATIEHKPESSKRLTQALPSGPSTSDKVGGKGAARLQRPVPSSTRPGGAGQQADAGTKEVHEQTDGDSE